MCMHGKRDSRTQLNGSRNSQRKNLCEAELLQPLPFTGCAKHAEQDDGLELFLAAPKKGLEETQGLLLPTE